MKGAKAKSKACNLPSVAPLSSLGRCVLPRLRGFFFSPLLLSSFPCLSIVHAACTRDGESRRFNRDLATSRKPIILAFRKAFIPAHWALNGSDILWWIAAAKWEQERYEGRGGRKQDTGGKKSTRNSLPFLPRGMECIGGTLHIFPIKRVSTLSLSLPLSPPTQVSQKTSTGSQRRSSFIHAAPLNYTPTNATRNIRLWGLETYSMDGGSARFSLGGRGGRGLSHFVSHILIFALKKQIQCCFVIFHLHCLKPGDEGAIA